MGAIVGGVVGGVGGAAVVAIVAALALMRRKRARRHVFDIGDDDMDVRDMSELDNHPITPFTAQSNGHTGASSSHSTYSQGCIANFRAPHDGQSVSERKPRATRIQRRFFHHGLEYFGRVADPPFEASGRIGVHCAIHRRSYQFYCCPLDSAHSGGGCGESPG